MVSTTEKVYGDDGRVRALVQVVEGADAIEIVTANDVAMDAVLFALDAGISVIRRTTVASKSVSGIDSVCAYLDAQPNIRAIGLTAESATDRLIEALVYIATTAHASVEMTKKMQTPLFVGSDILESMLEMDEEEE